jgi:hypothetical protein
MKRETKAYVDSLNNQRIGKGLEVGFLCIVIEDSLSLSLYREKHLEKKKAKDS